MITFSDFETAYLAYSAHHRLLTNLEPSHTHEELIELMMLTLEAEEKILENFGLPCTRSNTSLLKIFCIDPAFGLTDIPLLYDVLSKEATRYLTGSVLTDLQVLKFARQWGLPINEVLLQLSFGLKANAYCHFLYVWHFLPGCISAATFLEELRVVATHKLADRIYLLTLNPRWSVSNEYKVLSDYELDSLQDFLEYYSEFKKEHPTNYDFLN